MKTKRAVVTFKKLQGTIEQYDRKSIIRGYVNILEESLNKAQVEQSTVGYAPGTGT